MALNLSKLAIGPSASAQNRWNAKQNSLLQRRGRFGGSSSTQMFSSCDVNMCTSNLHSSLRWWRRISQLNFFLTNSVELSFMVYKILPYTSRSVLTATLWSGPGGHSIPIYPCTNWGTERLGNQSKITQLLSKRTSALSTSLLPHSPPFSAQTLWKRFLVLSSRPKWHPPVISLGTTWTVPIRKRTINETNCHSPKWDGVGIFADTKECFPLCWTMLLWHSLGFPGHS